MPVPPYFRVRLWSTWEKRSNTVAGGTDPHYYQELYASPHAEGRIYLADVRMRVSDDGGKTFRIMTEDFKHSDNHSLTFRKDDPDYLLVGTDGGLYESFDLAKNWRFVDNLPITQFYKVALDDTAPFYNVYGGTQDNNTQGGPSRTDSAHGIRNADWKVVLGGDGHQPATEPGNPAIMYAESQQGHLHRVDTTTGERVFIQPQAAPGEAPDRFNWDSPILVSPHQPSRIYYASQRVWRSDNRGDSWTAVSGDLTRDEERMQIPHMGRKWSYDAPWDLYAMSQYNTITSLAESPVEAGVLYAGTDDGLIQVSEDAGKSWRKIEVGRLPGVPKRAFVNDIKADLFDADTVYVALDNHKNGDFKPYMLVSRNRGKTWRSIVGNLPKRHLVWRAVQDHVRKDLLFAHRVRRVLHRRRRSQVDQAGGRHTDDLVPRPRDSATRKRPGRCHVRSRILGARRLHAAARGRREQLAGSGAAVHAPQGALVHRATEHGLAPREEGVAGQWLLRCRQPAVWCRAHLLPEGRAEDADPDPSR